ncbi:MAG: hypothetical protein IJ711_03515 [Lachnospiraceae bacterium]|nr:hypothetical protein [Lachnospiraceae bacterium]
MSRNNDRKHVKSKPLFRRTAALLLAVSLVATSGAGTDVSAAKKKDSAKTSKLHLEYSFGTPSFEAASYGYQVLLDDAAGLNEAGMPDLPSKTVSFLLPKGKTVKNVKVSKSGTKTYTDMLIAPSTSLAKVTVADEAGDDAWSRIQQENEATYEADTVSDNTASSDGQSDSEPQEEQTDADESTAADEQQQSEGTAGDGTLLSEETDENPEGVSFDGDAQEDAQEELDNAGKKEKLKTKIITDTIDFTDSSIFNQSVYTGASVYPASAVSEGSVQTVRGFSVYTVTLYPMCYSGTTLTYNEKMSLDITFEADDDKAEYIPTEADLDFLGDDVDISQFKSTYFSTASSTKTKTGTTIAGKGQIDYIIITNKALSKTFQQLADYKASKGLRTAVVTTEKIYKKYKGYDKPEKIRNFIKDAYSKNRVKYVLLGGDGDDKAKSSKAIVPTRLLYCKAVSSGEKPTYIASDLYYSCLDGTYDNNKNHKYGEEKDGKGGKDVDLKADVYVGRAPVDNKQEAQNFITKTINYETREKSAKALMIGERLDGNISCSVELASQLQNTVDADTLTNTIRRLRDEKLKPEYVSLYYDANDFVKAVYLDNLSLLGETVSLLTEYEPVIEEYVQTGTTSRTLQAEDISILQDYCKRFGNAIADSSRAYDRKQKLVEELNRFAKYVGDCEGMTYAEMFENSYLCRAESDFVDAAEFEKLDSIYGKTYKEEIRKGSKANNMKTKKIPSKYKVETLYDMDQESGSWTTEQLLEKLNASPEMINHLGHANVDSVMRLSVSEIKALKNERAFFFYSQGCYDGSFDNCNTSGKYSKDDCAAEELLVASPTSGAFACVVNSRYGWYNSDPSSTKGPSQIFDRLFWHQAMYGKDKSLGAILAKSRENKSVTGNLKDSTYGAVLRYCYYELNLLGDPETKLQDLNEPCLAQTTLKVKRSGAASSLSWTKVSGVSTYIIYRSDSKNGTYTKIGTAKGTSYTDSTAQKGTTYFYKVAAYKKVSGKKYYRYSKPVKAAK